jgi:hypothetical protein
MSFLNLNLPSMPSTAVAGATGAAIGLALCYTTYCAVDWWLNRRMRTLLSSALNDISSCPAANSLLLKAQEKARKYFGSDLEIRVGRTEMGAESQGNVITVSNCILSKELHRVLLFEIANISQTDRFNDVANLARGNQISAEGYAYEIEAIEHQSIQIASQIIKAASAVDALWRQVKIPVFWQQIEMLPDDHARFEFMKQHNPDHIEHYRRQHQRLRGTPRLVVME